MPIWLNPEVAYWLDEWRTIRDCMEGERVMKERCTQYLPRPEAMEEDADYIAYVTRATFYNFTGRTIGSLTGSIFRREPNLHGMPERLLPRMEAITKSNQSWSQFLPEVVEENVALGRVGVFLDLPEEATADPKPFLSIYSAENIIEWEETVINGRFQPTMIVLREAKETRGDKGERVYLPVFRKLVLVPGATAGSWEYQVHIFETPPPPAGKTVQEMIPNIFQAEPDKTIPVRVRGQALSYIPFVIMGPFKSTWAIEKPPSQDIARLNVSHFRSYAELENTRWFVGSPLYYVENPQGVTGDNDFTLGSTKVWEVASGAKPGVIELNGQGLKFLENALDQKEQQAAALGGRMMGVRGQAVSESDNQLKLAERNEQSVLLKVARSTDAGMTRILRWWAEWQGVPAEEAAKIELQVNKDFLFEGIGAREFRAVHAMYKDGFIPVDVLYHYLRKGDIIPDWMKIDEFTGLLDQMSAFPNNPDVEAKKEGYTNAAERFKEEQAALDRDLARELEGIKADTTLEEGDRQRKADEAIEKHKAKSALAAAKARPAPGAGFPKPAAKPAARPAPR